MEKRTSADSDLEWMIVLILYLKCMKVIQRERAPVATVFMGFVLLFFKRVPDCLLLCLVPVDSGLCFFSMALRSRRSWEVWDMTSEKQNFEGSSWRVFMWVHTVFWSNDVKERVTYRGSDAVSQAALNGLSHFPGTASLPALPVPHSWLPLTLKMLSQSVRQYWGPDFKVGGSQHGPPPYLLPQSIAVPTY